MPRITIRFLLFTTLLISAVVQAQISHGGRPLPFITVRSTSDNLFKEMPAFDLDEQKRIDSLEQSDLRGGYPFAYKFITDFTPANSGSSYILSDGTRVWRLGIRSANAYSINVLFTEYELPEGARLFLYNPDQSQILGSFNHLNNSEYDLLPVSPIDGDELIIEYQEPPGVDFSGRLRVGEVNHGYRSLRGMEPGDAIPDFACIPPVVCHTDGTTNYDDVVRSTVLLIINGTTLCSGALVNNTNNDKTPYLLTASHCLNNRFLNTNTDYVKVASTIVSFFNYESPFCDPVLRGTEELSMASARFYAVNEQTDMALLGLMDIPPVYYRPYYAGWNIAESHTPPYTNIHHPKGSVKRVNISSQNVELKTYENMPRFNPNSFWHLKEWEVGSTAEGSSGSPLFDSNMRVVGMLTGGKSNCENPKDDMFYALHMSWMAGTTDETNLMPWLDPAGTGVLVCDGIDPYGLDGAIELSNVRSSGRQAEAEVALLPSPASGQQFGINSLQTTEYAESYTINGQAKVYGAYFVTPPIQNYTNLTVQVNVYNESGTNTPGSIIYTTSFNPTYTNKQNLSDDFQESVKPLNRGQESFIKFDSAVYVSNRFFIGYSITATERDSFTVYSLPDRAVAQNTTWVNYQNTWLENTSHPVNPYKSSLFIDPVLRKEDIPIANISIPVSELGVSVDRELKRLTVILPERSLQVRYELFAIDGKLVRNGWVFDGQNQIQLLQTGVYILTLYLEGKKQVVKIAL